METPEQRWWSVEQPCAGQEGATDANKRGTNLRACGCLTDAWAKVSLKLRRAITAKLNEPITMPGSLENEGFNVESQNYRHAICTIRRNNLTEIDIEE